MHRSSFFGGRIHYLSLSCVSLVEVLSSLSPVTEEIARRRSSSRELFITPLVIGHEIDGFINTPSAHGAIVLHCRCHRPSMDHFRRFVNGRFRLLQ